MRFKTIGLKPSPGRGYIIALSRWRSRLALLAGIVTVSFSLYAIAGGMIYYAGIGRDVSELFHWFTINSNFLTALSACLIIPFAVEGIRKKSTFLSRNGSPCSITAAWSALRSPWCFPSG